MKAFYQHHFSHGKCFDEESLKRVRKWLTPDLYELLLYERRRAVPPDEAPHFVGDPFTASHFPPDSFRIGKSEQGGGGAKVEAFVYWHEQKRVVDQRKYSFVMLRHGGRWKIADIIDHEGGSLLGELKELKRRDGSSG